MKLVAVESQVTTADRESAAQLFNLTFIVDTAPGRPDEPRCAWNILNPYTCQLFLLSDCRVLFTWVVETCTLMRHGRRDPVLEQRRHESLQPDPDASFNS